MCRLFALLAKVFDCKFSVAVPMFIFLIWLHDEDRPSVCVAFEQQYLDSESCFQGLVIAFLI